MRLNFSIYILMSVFILISCRGTASKKPPIHILQNMDDVGRLDPQSQNLASYLMEDSLIYVSSDKMSMMKPVEGTVARDYNDYLADSEYMKNKYQVQNGKYYDGRYLEDIPSNFEVNQSFLNRGRERYDIYCSVCHGAIGDGQGIVINERFSWHRNMLPANYHDPEDIDISNWNKDGYIYSVIAYGVGNMNGYSHQISVDDRWSIVAYLRFLNQAYRDKIVADLKGMNTLKKQLLSEQFEQLVSIDKYDTKNIVQTFFDKKLMIEVQRIIGVDSSEPDGLWGEGSKRKWIKWKNNQSVKK